jgi:hypothetical protein
LRIVSNIIGIVAILLGILWSLQGAGYVYGSFMSGQPTWLYIGLATVLVGLVVLLAARRR